MFFSLPSSAYVGLGHITDGGTINCDTALVNYSSRIGPRLLMLVPTSDGAKYTTSPGCPARTQVMPKVATSPSPPVESSPRCRRDHQGSWPRSCARLLDVQRFADIQASGGRDVDIDRGAGAPATISTSTMPMPNVSNSDMVPA